MEHPSGLVATRWSVQTGLCPECTMFMVVIFRGARRLSPACQPH